MIRLDSLSFRTLACTLVLTAVPLAQTHSPVVGRHASAVAPDPSAQQLAEALASQQRALDGGDPVAIASATRLASACLLHEVAKLRLLEGKPADAIDLERRSLALHDSSAVRLELASTLLRTGAQQDAVKEASLVLQAEPANPSAWAIRGSALLHTNDYRGAIDAFNHSLEYQANVNVAYAMASAELSLHEKDKAALIFRKIIAASDNAAIWHVAAGDAYREALYLNEAVEEFKKAIAIDPRVGHAEFFLGLTYLQMNEWGPNSQSFEHLRAAVRLAPREYVSNFYLGAIESTDGSDLASSNRHLHVAAEANPESPEVWLYLGLNASREHNIDAAKTYLRKAVELTGDDVARNNYQIRRVYAILGRILISEGNHAEGDALLAKYKNTEQSSIGNSAHAIAQAAEAQDAAVPLSGVAATDAGVSGMHAGTMIAAPEHDSMQPLGASTSKPVRTPAEEQQIAARERQLDELLASSLNDLGTANARQGHYDEALANFTEAAHWQTPTQALLRNLGVAAFRTGHYDESADALSRYFAAEASSPDQAAPTNRLRLMLAMSYFSLGKFSEADKAFTPVGDLVRQDPRTAYSWAYAMAHSGQQQRANELADALSSQNLPSDNLSLVCHLYVDTENYEQSAACYRRAYTADPGLKLAHYEVAEALIHLDRAAEAVPELREELLLSPDNPNVKYSLAFALLQSSHKEEAMTILQALTQANPTHAQAQYQLGKLLLEQGDAAGAIQHLELAERSDPAPDYIHYQLQAAYRKAGRTDDADRELKLYREIKAHNREVTPAH